MKNHSKNMALTIIFIALAIALSPFTSIPVGIAKINPTQHFINVMLSVLASTRWSVGAAAGIAILRNAMGTGSLLAFPGGMIGAFCSGVVYKLTKNIYWAAFAEVLGTGLVAPVISSFLVAPFLMGKNMAVFVLMPSFLFSTITGSFLAIVSIRSLKNSHAYVS